MQFCRSFYELFIDEIGYKSIKFQKTTSLFTRPATKPFLPSKRKVCFLNLFSLKRRNFSRRHQWRHRKEASTFTSNKKRFRRCSIKFRGKIWSTVSTTSSRTNRKLGSTFVTIYYQTLLKYLTQIWELPTNLIVNTKAKNCKTQAFALVSEPTL